MCVVTRERRTRGRERDQKRYLYRSVCDALRRRLSQGDLKVGTPLPPLRELARQFKVSTVTARQALHILEKEGQVQCVPGVGIFVPLPVHASRVTEQTTIAFVTIEMEDALTADIANHIGEACAERGWGMQVFNAHGDTQLEARNLSRVAKSGLTAAIILPADDSENLEAMVRLKLNGLPIVLVDRAMPELKVDIVESDHEKGAYLATEYLLKGGHQRVLMVTQKPTLTSLAGRLRGYEQALIDHGLEPLFAWKVWTDNAIEDEGRRQGRRWLGGYTAILPVLEEMELPVAVFAHNAYSGWGVFEACRELGLHVPNDVSIVCFDDAEFTQALAPPMTAIRQRTDEIARIAVELLERRLSDRHLVEPQRILLDVELIERGSVAAVKGLPSFPRALCRSEGGAAAGDRQEN